MDVIYLTLDQVIEIHDDAIREFGGLTGLHSLDLLESAVYQPQQSLFGDDAYPGIGSKAAAYGYFLLSNHPFLDGNKRTAVDSMLVFIDVNGCHLNRSDEDLEEVVVSAAARKISKEAFFQWIEESVEALRSL